MWNMFLERITFYINKFVPLRTKSTKGSSKLSVKTKRLSSKAYKLHKKWKSSPHSNRKYRRYLRASAKAQASKHQDIEKIESKVLSSGKNSRFWQFVRSKLNYKESIPSLLDDKGRIISSASEKAELLNDYFCSVFCKSIFLFFSKNFGY